MPLAGGTGETQLGTAFTLGVELLTNPNFTTFSNPGNGNLATGWAQGFNPFSASLNNSTSIVYLSNTYSQQISTTASGSLFSGAWAFTQTQTLNAQHCYRFTGFIYAQTSAQPVQIIASHGSSSNYVFLMSKTINCQPGVWQQFSIEFQCDTTDTSAFVGINTLISGTINLCQFSLKEIMPYQYTIQNNQQIAQSTVVGGHIIDFVYSGTPWTIPGTQASGWFGVFRCWDSGFYWSQVEPSQGTFLFTSNTPVSAYSLDQLYTTCVDCNFSLYYTCGITPSWAASANTLLPSDVSTTGPWGVFINNLATHYAGKIKFYELWNEVDGTTYYTDTQQRLVEACQSAAQIIRSIDPLAKIVAPSITTNSPNMQYLDELLYLGLANAPPQGTYSVSVPTFDVVSLHNYVTYPSTIENCSAHLFNIRQLLDSYGLNNIMLFNGEFNYIDSSWSNGTSGVTATDQSIASRLLLVNRLFSDCSIFYSFEYFTGTFLWLIPSQTSTSLNSAGISYVTTYGWLNGALITNVFVGTNGTWEIDLILSSAFGNKTACILWNAVGSTPTYTFGSWFIPQKKYTLDGNNVSFTSSTIVLSNVPVMISE